MVRYINNNYKYDIATMNPALSTALQSWSRPKLITITVILLVIHIGVFLMGAFVAPSMFHASKVPGTVCTKEKSMPTWYQDQASDSTRCLPTSEANGNQISSLNESLLAFRFPASGTKPRFYDRWNWRLLGSLYLSLSFNASEDGDEIIVDNEGNNVTAAFAVNRRNVPVTMEAKLDGSTSSMMMGGAIDQSTDEDQRLFDWVRLSELKANRKLQCTVTSLQPDSVVDYSCTLTPLFSIDLLSNQSYILQLSFSPSSTLKNSSTLEEQDSFGITERLVVVKELSLTLIVEDQSFHTALFYLKCFCVPFILGALVIFAIRLYLNDLYVSIPDRLLVTCALAQVIHDIPVEALIADGNLWQPSPYLKLMDDLGRFLLITCLFLFWIIYTKDKISTKEPWERNTRYYWRQIISVALGGLIAGMWALYGRGPGLSNAFKNHWLVDTPTVLVSLGLIFSLAALALAYQTYLSVLIFRALCDISVVHYRQHYCSASGRSYIPHRIWRIKMVLLYSFAVSVLTIGGLILHLAVELSLHWNPQFYLNPIPFHLTFASAYILGLNGLWNLYIVTLLLMLARSTSGSSASGLSTAGGQDPSDYRVQPVTYTCRSLDIDFHQHHNVAVYSDGECVLDSLTSNHFSSGEESNLKRRQSSEDFLEMQAARRQRHHDYCHYDEFSDDDYDEEAMVDEEDPLEMARQGTVHLWENEEVVCHGSISDAFIAISSNSSPTGGAGASDDAVLYRD